MNMLRSLGLSLSVGMALIGLFAFIVKHPWGVYIVFGFITMGVGMLAVGVLCMFTGLPKWASRFFQGGKDAP